MISCLELLQPDVFGGLAREALALDQQRPEPLLLLWRSESAVVLGKNQNPWKECNLQLLQERGLPLARRISGGGTVYHDPGNLNISWVIPREQYVPESLYAVLRAALTSWGLAAETHPNGATLIGGKKISGSAFCYRKTHVLHHGTLLVDANLAQLRAVLSPPQNRLSTHAVASIPAAVQNLSALRPEISLDMLCRTVKEAAAQAFGPLFSLNAEALQPSAAALNEIRQPEWIYGQTPAFRLQLPLGGTSASLEIRRGSIEKIFCGGVPLPLSAPLPFSPAGLPPLAKLLDCGESALAGLLRQQGIVFPGTTQAGESV